MKVIKLKGKTSEEKFKHIEFIFKSLFMRLGNKIVEKIPAVPLSGYKFNVTPDDNIIHYIIPFDAKLEDAFIYIADRSNINGEIIINVEVIESDCSSTFFIKLNRNASQGNVQINKEVKAGTRLRVRVVDVTLNEVVFSIAVLSQDFNTKDHLLNNSNEDLLKELS